jgi:NTP pyrophosphatase (non-canonical NTP hydrolase)
MTIGFREYPTLGLCGETGEVAEKVKKQVRDGVFNRHEVAKELGDVLWYLANLSNDIGYNLDEIANINIEKLTSRKNRDKIKGSGDNR